VDGIPKWYKEKAEENRALVPLPLVTAAAAMGTEGTTAVGGGYGDELDGGDVDNRDGGDGGV
jgi:hypothetical protein